MCAESSGSYRASAGSPASSPPRASGQEGFMRRLSIVVATALLSIALPVVGQVGRTAPAQRASTTAAVAVRESPAPGGRLLATLPTASIVDIEHCDSAWCAIRYRGLSGYTARHTLAFRAAPSSSDSPSPRVQEQGRGYVNSHGEWVPSPVHTPDGRAPAGASARCRDGSFSFSRSRRGTCSHHGGVSEWL